MKERLPSLQLAFSGKSLTKPIAILFLHPLAIGLSYGAVEQYPGLTVAARLFL